MLVAPSVRGAALLFIHAGPDARAGPKRRRKPPDVPHPSDRCLAQFEDFCIVTESVRHGIPVGVRVVDNMGQELFAAGKHGAPARPAIPA
jgi:hypothetical protein